MNLLTQLNNENQVRLFHTAIAGLVFLFVVLCALPGENFSDTGESRTMISSAEIIPLPPPEKDSTTSVEQALQERRSVREFKPSPISLQDLAQLLWSAQGITDRQGLRTAPSAGALYPMKVYVVTGNVENLLAGVYHYRPHAHQLTRISKEDKRSQLASAAWDQEYVEHNATVLVFSAVEKRATGKYGRRGIRYIHIEVGHAAQNVFLQAESLGLATVTVGAFDDDQVRRIMQMPEGEVPLYLLPVGKP